MREIAKTNEQICDYRDGLGNGGFVHHIGRSHTFRAICCVTAAIGYDGSNLVVETIIGLVCWACRCEGFRDRRGLVVRWDWSRAIVVESRTSLVANGVSQLWVESFRR